MEDKLLDILVHIPGLVQTITASQPQKTRIRELKEELIFLRSRLTDWRIEWHKLNPDSATETNGALNDGNNIPPFAASFLSSALSFQTAQQALELICYHSTMLYLAQLEYVLEGDSPEYRILRSISNYQATFHQQIPRRQMDTPLFLPEEIQFTWQHGLEGLRILAGFRAALPANPELYLTFAPLAILYCFSRYISIHQTMISMISGEPWGEDAEEELGPYRLYDFENARSQIHGNVGSGGMAEHGSSTSSGTAVAKQLFVNTSWP